ncbi:MAG TPA: sigma-70 family RNA polymerase sigma factor [Kofleriaceae bacterium]
MGGEGEASKRARVALVDDDLLYLRGIKRVLARRAEHLDLCTFTRGDDAVAYLEENPVDIVILDIRLPGLDGFEICRRVKAKHPATWIAITSSHLSAEARETAAAAGADRAVAKPYDIPSLIEERNGANQTPSRSNAVSLLSSDHLEMAKNIAGSLARRYGSFISPDEIDSLALLGLCEAAARYDANQNGLFIAFAASRIRGSVLDEIRKTGSKSRTDYEREKKVTATRRQLDEAKQSSSDEDVAAMLGCAVSDLQKVRASWIRLPTQEMRTLPSDLPEIGEMFEVAQQKDRVARARAGLVGLEAEVIRLHYDAGMSLHEIAGKLNIHERKVIQLHQKGVARLRDLCSPVEQTA